MAENEHEAWLRKQGHALRQAAEAELDAKKKAAFEKKASRMFAVADAFAMALAGADLEAMGGHKGLQKRLRPGVRVVAHLMCGGGALKGEIRAMGRYDFALRVPGGVEVVVPKHAVLYWELLDSSNGASAGPEAAEEMGVAGPVNEI